MAVPTSPPKTRTVSARSVVFALDGKEKNYPVYRFGRKRTKVERPKHNPFTGL